ncbi:hypothetical protein H5410_004546 [Solanum commersonii]|uniref:Uncharacterized protein n=1 Tax=Solanum commersonii TaxID=4109 RepID=A0A9J6B7N4_SOLCO|nr:hypothetical protein H5410_004546 [Solanum commersonii]
MPPRMLLPSPSGESNVLRASQTSWTPTCSFVLTAASHGASGASCCCTCNYRSSAYSRSELVCQPP